MGERGVCGLGAVRRWAPLVHCLMGPIVSHACAGIVLAAGGRPIMAAHPREVEAITAGADALLINLGGISDARMRAMRLSAAVAARRGIPIVLDAVGAGCSGLRLDFALELLEQFQPAIVKGNRAEIAALAARHTTARGVDAKPADLATGADALLRQAAALAVRHGAIVVVSGPVDVATDGERGLRCENGHAIMARVCGTGCMLGALTAACAPGSDPLDAAALALAAMGVAGERAASACGGPGSFVPALLDAVYQLTDAALARDVKLKGVGI